MISGHGFLKLLAWNVVDHLREDGAAGVHPPLFRTRDSPSLGAKTAFWISNRSRAERRHHSDT
jgi:hypothetical protein